MPPGDDISLYTSGQGCQIEDIHMYSCYEKLILAIGVAIRDYRSGMDIIPSKKNLAVHPAFSSPFRSTYYCHENLSG
jgi:hypothetical protein